MIDIKLNNDIDMTFITRGTDKHLVIKFDNGEVVDPEPAPEPEPPVEPEPPIDRSAIKVYDEDLSESVIVSTPSLPVFPHGLSAAFDMEYLGSFRVNARGESSSNFAKATIGLNKDNNSLFMAGHDQHDAIAEFSLDAELSKSEVISEIPSAPILQDYEIVLDSNENNKVTGLHVIDGQLFVNSEIAYDAGTRNQDALQVLDASNLDSSDKTIFNRVQGDAKIAGYIGDIPEDAQSLFNGAKYFMGNASNHSIVSRYSVGPSFATFDPNDLQDNVLPTIQKMVFPYSHNGSTHITPKGDDTSDDNPSPIWNTLTKARYAFIVPNSKLLCAIGTNGGLHSGILYKSDSRYPDVLCHGSCTPEAKDNYNWFMLFSLDDIASAEQPHLIKPISYGKWSHPHDDGEGNVKGGAYDIDKQILYVSLGGKGQVGKYDRPPLINAYKVTAKEL